MAWDWGFGTWRDMEIYLQHWSPIFLCWYGSLWMLHLSNHTCIGLCRLNHSHAYLFYIIYDGTLWQMPQSYITFAFTKNSHYTYSIDQDLFLLVIYTTVCWRVLASQGSSTYRFANKVPYFSNQTPCLISSAILCGNYLVVHTCTASPIHFLALFFQLLHK